MAKHKSKQPNYKIKLNPDAFWDKTAKEIERLSRKEYAEHIKLLQKQLNLE